MIESPLIQEIVAEIRHKDILRILKFRFQTIPLEIPKLLAKIEDETKLDHLADWCSNVPISMPSRPS